jgi:DNA invertase Pin-like site-specific DNA recombinase
MIPSLVFGVRLACKSNDRLVDNRPGFGDSAVFPCILCPEIAYRNLRPATSGFDGFLDNRTKSEGDCMKIGYARVSTIEQNLDLQRDALKAAGCKKIIEDTASGGKVKRDGLERVKELLREGDVLAVWRLDRLGRTLKHLIELMAELEGHGIGFQSTTEAIDTTTPGGKLVFHIFAALAEFERNIIRERTKAGLEAARARGRKGGRRPVLDAKKRAMAVELYRGKKHSIGEICQLVRVKSRTTLYKAIAEAEREGGGKASGIA